MTDLLDTLGARDPFDAAVMGMALFFLDRARRWNGGVNPPFGLWVAEFAGGPYADVAWQAGHFARQVFDEQRRGRIAVASLPRGGP